MEVEGRLALKALKALNALKAPKALKALNRQLTSRPRLICFSERLVPAGDGAEATANRVHEAPDPRAREGVPLQSLLVAPPTNRDRAHARPDRAPDKDLVPEPAHEVEEGQQAAQHEEREAEKRERPVPAGQGWQGLREVSREEPEQQQQPAEEQQQLAPELPRE
jgi:hypothetical protein